MLPHWRKPVPTEEARLLHASLAKLPVCQAQALEERCISKAAAPSVDGNQNTRAFRRGL